MSKNHQFEISFFEDILRKSPKYTEVIEILGGLYTEAGRIDDGLKMDRKLVRLMPGNPTAHYNLACSLSLKSRSTDALRALAKAIDLGYTDVEWMQMDPDLDPLRKHPQFKTILKQLKGQN